MRSFTRTAALTALLVALALPAQASDEHRVETGSALTSEVPSETSTAPPASKTVSAKSSRKKTQRRRHAARKSAKAKASVATPVKTKPPPKPRVSVGVVIGSFLAALFLTPALLGFLRRLRRPRRAAARAAAPEQASSTAVSYAQVREACYALPQMREQPRVPEISTALSHNGEMLAVLRQATACDPRVIQAWPVLNGEERDLFDDVLTPWAQEHRLRLFAQVSMGEFIKSSDPEVRRTFNAKRVDFLIADWLCNPVMAIEYFGGLHDQGDAAERDAIKALALASAQVGLLIVKEGYDPSAVRADLDARLFAVEAERKVYPVFAMGSNTPARRAS